MGKCMFLLSYEVRYDAFSPTSFTIALKINTRKWYSCCEVCASHQVFYKCSILNRAYCTAFNIYSVHKITHMKTGEVALRVHLLSTFTTTYNRRLKLVDTAFWMHKIIYSNNVSSWKYFKIGHPYNLQREFWSQGNLSLPPNVSWHLNKV